MGKGRGLLAGALALCLAWCGATGAGEVVQAYDYGTAEYGESLEPQRIVVTASRIPTPVEQVPETTTVFTAQPNYGQGGLSGESVQGSALGGVGLMEARQYRDVADALRSTPGVSVHNYGTTGSIQSVRLRGMDSHHTGFFLDGMPMDDPLTNDRSTDMSSYTLDNIGQLEVLRGPQSALYGSNAMAGVVNLSSKRGEGPFSGFASTEAGSYGTLTTRVGAQAGNERGDFAFGGSFLHTDGWSSADKANGNRERDGYDRGSVNLRLGYNVGDNVRFDLFTNGAKANLKLDNDEYTGGGPYGYEFTDVDNLWQKNQRFMIRPQVTLSLLDGRWVQKAGFGYLKNDRQYKSTYVTDYKNRYEATTTKFDYQSVFHTHENNSILAGVDIITESARYTDVAYGPGKTRGVDIESVTTTAVYVEDQFNWRETIFLNAGLRYEHNDDFGSKTTWKTSAMYALPTGTRFKATAGSGFSTPTVYVLHFGLPTWNYAPNPNLKPEKSLGWDVGFEQDLFEERLVFGSSFFWNRVKDKISGIYDWSTYSGTYENLGMYRTWGLESFLRLRICDSLTISAQHTWLRTKQKQEGDTHYEPMPGRPEHEFGVDVDWQFHRKGFLTVGVHHKGDQFDQFGDRQMPSFTLARIAASWKVTDNLEVFGRVENVFNKKYQQYYGYGTQKISFYGGLTMSF